MKDLISVIMPVYNVADYLPQSIDSVLNQDHRNLQLILIDDGSTDGSGAICDAYAAADSRVQVIHQANAGAAAAKNAGLRAAEGEYLSFVDSDDFLEPDVYGYMLQTLLAHGADAAQFSFQDVYRSRKEPHLVQPGLLTEREFLRLFLQDWTCALLWNKLYKRSLFAGVFFEEGHKIDDEYFTYRGFLEPSKVVLDDKIIYNYRKRRSSVMGSPAAGEQRILDCIDSIAKRRQRVVQRWPELRKVFDSSYLDTIWYLSENIHSTEKTIAVLKAHLKAYLLSFGNTLPPRYLWKRLWRLYRTKTQVLLESCTQKQTAHQAEDYFA